jgi:acyl carrier protein
MITCEPTTRARVVAAIAEILEIEPSCVAGTQRLREDLGMDSLGSLELLSTIGEELRIDLEMEDAMGIVTVDDACTFVERRRAEGPTRANRA